MPIEGWPRVAANAPSVLEPVLDHRHVLEADGRALLVGDHEAPEGVEVDGFALGAHVHLALGGLDAARGHLQVLAVDGADHVVDGEALRLHAGRRRTRRARCARGSR